jgi:hypothetical protein
MDGKELQRYNEVLSQMQFYRAQAYSLEGELRAIRPQLYRADQKIDRLEQRLAKVTAENTVFRKRLAELTGQLDRRPKTVPAFVKANVPGRGGRPGMRRRSDSCPRRSTPTSRFRSRAMRRAWPVARSATANSPRCVNTNGSSRTSSPRARW